MCLPAKSEQCYIDESLPEAQSLEKVDRSDKRGLGRFAVITVTAGQDLRLKCLGHKFGS